MRDAATRQPEEGETRKSRRWYVKYDLDAYALGPYQFDEPVDAAEAIATAKAQFGEEPAEVWPD